MIQKVLLCFVFSTIFISSAFCQIEKILEPQSLDSYPVFEGGEKQWNKYLKKNLVYPDFAKRNGIQGVVYVIAKIDSDGIVIETEIFKGIHDSCDSAAKDVVKNSYWRPGKLRNENGDLVPVISKVVIPITFR